MIPSAAALCADWNHGIIEELEGIRKSHEKRREPKRRRARYYWTGADLEAQRLVAVAEDRNPDGTFAGNPPHEARETDDG